MAQNKDTTDYEKLLYGAQATEDPLLEMMKFLLDRILDRGTHLEPRLENGKRLSFIKS